MQKLGRVLRHVLYVERGRKVSAAEQLRLSRQSDALEAVFASADCGIMRHTDAAVVLPQADDRVVEEALVRGGGAAVQALLAEALRVVGLFPSLLLV